VIIVLTVVSIIREGTETDRLRANGVPATATVTNWSSSNRSAKVDRIDLTYQHNGGTYTAAVHCRSFGNCDVRTGGSIQIWVDPKRPVHFATEFGTDGSNSWFTSIGMLVPGLALALIGAAATYFTLVGDKKRRPPRRSRRQRR
jgi:hypothetical protein